MPRVNNATVTLWDGAIAYALNETVPGSSGIYTTDSTFTGRVNKTYTVQIQLPEAISGHTAFDAACYLPPVTHLDSVTYVFHPEYGKEGIWFINLWAQEPGDEVNYYMFNLYRNGKLMTDSIQKKRISDDALINGKYMTGITVFTSTTTINSNTSFRETPSPCRCRALPKSTSSSSTRCSNRGSTCHSSADLLRMFREM